MNKGVGLWIDHKRAVIVSMTDDGQKIETLNANIEKPDDGNIPPADNIQQRVETEHLNKFYDRVIASLDDPESIFLIGPGEAKGELQKRLEKTQIDKSAITVETADSMTDPQIAAKVREHFAFATTPLGIRRTNTGGIG